MQRTILFSLLIPFIVNAQLISIKSLPVVTSDQFLIFPSADLSIGDVSIALDNPWPEPFINPAKGTNINQTNVFIFAAPYSALSVDERFVYKHQFFIQIPLNFNNNKNNKEGEL